MTLGIPRLRELLMTAAQSIKTPVMTLPLQPACASPTPQLILPRPACPSSRCPAIIVVLAPSRGLNPMSQQMQAWRCFSGFISGL